ncbi:hypothetical protein [Methylomonas rapida]|uniref:Uncharacterized protein n=1 Tax=Methylomonas rapida TaxID=2963939 RepID=A0ABY7GHQ1_9GAMM|nr:hypothetical protein [Methylomonas rapida]WAR44031.1 hypothetical protein NM686_016885 [Methylomonas rapida]
MICSTQTALIELFNTAKHNLTSKQLNFFGNLLLHADEEAQSLADTLLVLARADAHNSTTSDEIRGILNGMAYKAGTIASLVQIGIEAKEMAEERKEEPK